MIESTRATENEARASGADAQKKRLKESCQDFEAVLVDYLFKTMRQSTFRSDEPDRATELYESMMDESVARQFSRQEGLGLSRALYNSLAPKLERRDSEEASTKPAKLVNSAKTVVQK